MYIIDANNLAGKLNILKEKNFDSRLIGMLMHYFLNKKIDIVLVFDGRDVMGDKEKKGYFTIIYTPKDTRYNGEADRKIFELVEANKEKKQLRVVTGDLELSQSIKKISSTVEIINASSFAEKILKALEIKNDFNDDGEELSRNEQDEITKELMGLWG